MLFFVCISTHSLTKSDLIRIDLFFNDSDSLSSQVLSTSNHPSCVLTPLPLHSTRSIHTNHSTGTDTLLSGTPEAKLRLRLWIHLYVNPHAFLIP